MSERESEAWASKLTRIWAPHGVVDWFRGTHNSDNASFAFRAMLTDEVCFTCRDSNSSPGLLFRLSPQPQEHLLCHANHLRCYSKIGQVELVNGDVMELLSDNTKQFAAQWMDTFRRNCWLSGCPIEASAHEQLEWMLWLQEQEKAH